MAPAQAGPQLVAKLNGLPGAPVRARVVASEDVARAGLRDASPSAALLVNPSAATDRLLIASGGGTSVATAVEQIADKVEAAQHRGVQVSDVVPLQSGDNRGLTGFYLLIGWIVGGYLVAAALGVAKGARPATLRRGLIRLGSLVPYAIASGLFGALIVDQLLGALTGHLVALWWLGALAVFGPQRPRCLRGAVRHRRHRHHGAGLRGARQPVGGRRVPGALLPPFWRALSGALPNGAATDTVRRVAYFGAHGITGHLVVLAIYAAAGAAVALGASWLNQRRSASAASG